MLKNTRGGYLTEYALMLAFVAITVGAVVPSFGRRMIDTFEKVNAVLALSGSVETCRPLPGHTTCRDQ